MVLQCIAGVADARNSVCACVHLCVRACRAAAVQRTSAKTRIHTNHARPDLTSVRHLSLRLTTVRPCGSKRMLSGRHAPPSRATWRTGSTKQAASDAAGTATGTPVTRSVQRTLNTSGYAFRMFFHLPWPNCRTPSTSAFSSCHAARTAPVSSRVPARGMWRRGARGGRGGGDRARPPRGSSSAYRVGEPSSPARAVHVHEASPHGAVDSRAVGVGCPMPSRGTV